jgi:hypothetical protein
MSSNVCCRNGIYWGRRLELLGLVQRNIDLPACAFHLRIDPVRPATM